MKTSFAAASALSVRTPSEGRAVHENEIEGPLVLQKQIAQDDFAADDSGQLHLGGGKVDVRPGNPEALTDLPPHFGERTRVDEYVIHGWRLAVRLDAEVSRRMRLGVEIENADALAAFRQRRREIDRRRGFAYAALLVDDRDPSHDSSSGGCPDSRNAGRHYKLPWQARKPQAPPPRSCRESAGKFEHLGAIIPGHQGTPLLSTHHEQAQRRAVRNPVRSNKCPGS